jgi:hypothetical protein
MVMKINCCTLDVARAAKAKASTLLADLPVVGIGVTRVGEGYGLKINLSEAVPAVALPEQIDGVPVKAEVVGEITQR